MHHHKCLAVKTVCEMRGHCRCACGLILSQPHWRKPKRNATRLKKWRSGSRPIQWGHAVDVRVSATMTVSVADTPASRALGEVAREYERSGKLPRVRVL